MKEMCKNIEDDRRQLMSEVTEQNKLVDSLSREKTCKHKNMPLHKNPSYNHS